MGRVKIKMNHKDYTILSVVVPCYNEEENIAIFYKEACNVLEIIGKRDNI